MKKLDRAAARIIKTLEARIAVLDDPRTLGSALTGDSSGGCEGGPWPTPADRRKAFCINNDAEEAMRRWPAPRRIREGYANAKAAIYLRFMTSFTVNDRPVRYRMDPDTPLLWALRDASNLTGTKYGCGTGDCGACIVDIDGEAIRSCQISIAQAEGRFVTTIEALSPDRSNPVQQAWAAENLPQCGFCQPGMIMAAAVLLKRNANPTDADIDAAITNLCRCGTYPRIREAVRRAGLIMRGDEQVAAAPPPGVPLQDAARTVPSLRAP